MTEIRNSRLDKVLGQLDHLDETNLQNLASRLARERELFEGIFNTVCEGILVISADGVLQYANREGMAMVGIRESDLGSAFLWKWIPDLAPAINLDHRQPQFSEQALVTREIEMTYPEPRIVRVYIVPFEKLQGAGKHYVVILNDITKDVVSTEEKIESEKMASLYLLAAGVAHELGNPLNSLTIHLQLMQRQLDQIKDREARGKLKVSLDICSDEVVRLDGIITHFLEAIRPTPLDLNDTNLVEVLESVLRVQEQELSNAGISIELETGNEVPMISGDANQLKQVFFNVIKNACEAMTEGGILTIKLKEDDDFFYILIGDTGSGIEPQHLSKVFHPYFSTKASGSGLGLMIVNRILRDHGGQVGIDSKTGIGTVVSLKFPKKHRRVRLLPE